MMLYLLMLLPLCASAAESCTGKADGIYKNDDECRSFTQCSGEKFDLIDCPFGLVFDSDRAVCDRPKNVPPPCGTGNDCSNLHDGLYADSDRNCTSFYICNNHIFLGNRPCPGGLVFNEDVQNCDWKWSTNSPCGNRP